MNEKPPSLLRAPARAKPAVDSIPGLMRVSASAALHTTEWGVKTSAKAWLRVGRAVVRPGEAELLARDVGRAVAVVGELAKSMSEGAPVADALMEAGASLGGLVERTEVVDGAAKGPGRSEVPERTLREQGQSLLEQSRDVWSSEQGHPAYERILTEMAPDEARLLMLLLRDGPQPSVDVRTGGPIGMVNSQLIAPGLTMMGARSGARYLDQVPAYLNNLHRLGLIWFSREALSDPMHYQVVEAQPDVLEALHSVRFAKVVRRSIHLTPFGEDFAKRCLLEADAPVEDLPEHATPSNGEENPDEG